MLLRGGSADLFLDLLPFANDSAEATGVILFVGGDS